MLNADTFDKSNDLMDLPEKHPGYTHIALEVTDISAVQQQMQSLSIPITEGPVRFTTGTSLFIRDPDGNVIEFHQPA